VIGKSSIGLYLRINQAIWNRLPPAVRNSAAAYWYGTLLHKLVCYCSERRQYVGTFFLRNRPQLDHVRRLVAVRANGSEIRIAVLGCSIGAEVYSLLWTIRSARPELRVKMSAVDTSAEVLEVAAKGVYTDAASGLVAESIFERLTDTELGEIFDWQAGVAMVKPWLREGVTFHLGDAADPNLPEVLGPQDIVIASNFLCHMEPAMAEKCLRNLGRLVNHEGYLFVIGVDLDVRAKVARELDWRPVIELVKEIHDGDPSVREDWPWKWWGLEPLNERRRDWQLRYSAAFQLRGKPLSSI
jgi:chemotaxis protein methyltransferase CheR